MRKLIVISCENAPSTETAGAFLANFPAAQGQIILPEKPQPIPFSNAKTLLGQEFASAIYDMRAKNGVCLNLEALAIVAGTIQQHGSLYLLCPNWHDLDQQIDWDSLRWNGQQAIATPHFHRYFQQLVHQFGFEITSTFPPFPQKRYNATKNGHNEIALTAEQQHIFSQLPQDKADIHLITAPRGRGKSTLSGKLAAKIAERNGVIITARSHSALPNFWKSLESAQVAFFAPDKLIQLIEAQQISPHQWLFIDEAASLPLPMLAKCCGYFKKVVLTTTTQNYEGTGRGFCLKLPPLLQRPVQQWRLTQPLRWGENDPLEAFIHRLLLLEEGDHTSGQIFTDFQTQIGFYHLLAQAHYKTTPTDLRRLFDAPDQHFYQIEQDQQLLAGCWAMDEGGMSEDLAYAIWRGERRPAGSLVAQYLCFQGNLPLACQLRSRRISRLAVQPAFQRQGLGKQLILQMLSEIEPTVDFVSVSFGMSLELLRFWTQCGFQLVQITPNAEASSGLRSAMMIYPISPRGNAFCQQACQQFWRDLPLQPFYTALPADIQQEVKKEVQKIVKICPLVENNTALNSQDWQNLRGFAHTQRTLASCYTSLWRLYQHFPEPLSTLKPVFEATQGTPLSQSKAEVANIRQQLRDFLQTM